MGGCFIPPFRGGVERFVTGLTMMARRIPRCTCGGRGGSPKIDTGVDCDTCPMFQQGTQTWFTDALQRAVVKDPA